MERTVAMFRTPLLSVTEFSVETAASRKLVGVAVIGSIRGIGSGNPGASAVVEAAEEDLGKEP
jgi:hypothetical protein